jgi:phenylpyruvate tautomerase PptA (4-oxalocrotonate tautomerase family)
MQNTPKEKLMPAFKVIVPEGRLSSEQKARVAAAVGRTYKELTGVPESLTQVIFIEVKNGNYFVGSVPLDTDQISVEGHLRTGRGVEAKRSLVGRIVEAVAQAAAMPKSHVWAHLVDMPATQIVEFGRVVPEPGGEAAWITALSEAERKEIGPSAASIGQVSRCERWHARDYGSPHGR